LGEKGWLIPLFGHRWEAETPTLPTVEGDSDYRGNVFLSRIPTQKSPYRPPLPGVGGMRGLSFLFYNRVTWLSQLTEKNGTFHSFLIWEFLLLPSRFNTQGYVFSRFRRLKSRAYLFFSLTEILQGETKGGSSLFPSFLVPPD